MYLAKQAMLYKHAVPDGQAYIFYIDTRSTGKGYEEFVQRGIAEGTTYLRGKVSKIYRDGEKISVVGADTLSGRKVDILSDMVVLAMAILPSHSNGRLFSKLGLETDINGFIIECHHKFNPLETSVTGIYVAGTAQGPKDIPDSVAQGSGAAGKVIVLFAQPDARMFNETMVIQL
jgi:heterodisulfide reductase subunit A